MQSRSLENLNEQAGSRLFSSLSLPMHCCGMDA